MCSIVDENFEKTAGMVGSYKKTWETSHKFELHITFSLAGKSRAGRRSKPRHALVYDHLFKTLSQTLSDQWPSLAGALQKLLDRG